MILMRGWAMFATPEGDYTVTDRKGEKIGSIPGDALQVFVEEYIKNAVEVE